MKTFIRRSAVALLGAHFTGALAIYFLENDAPLQWKEEQRFERIALYALSPYALVISFSYDATDAIKTMIQDSSA
jgi:hypothetical protein